MMPREVVIVGYGMAGSRLAEDLRQRDPHGTRLTITALEEETTGPYNRVLLSNVVSGSMPARSLRLQDPDWARQSGVRLRLGRYVVGVDRVLRRVKLDDGSSVGYDRLVLATGASALIPAVDGLREPDGGLAPGVVTFRTLADCDRLVAAARTGEPVAVLGGGLLGLEAARGLAAHGCPVTVVHATGHLMERQLDRAAGRVLARTLRRLGIGLRLGAAAECYRPGQGLVLEDGGVVPAGLVVVCAGVAPNTALAAGAGLRVDRGVVIDDRLRTSDPHVYAIGDCAQHPGTVSGLVQPAWEQAAVLAALLSGADPAARYQGSEVVIRLKTPDIALTSFGEVHTDEGGEDVEVLSVSDPARGRYAKLVVRNDLVAGAIVLGFADAAATLIQLYDRRTPLPPDRLPVLLGKAASTALPAGPDPAHMPGSSLVCLCNSVSKAQLVAAWQHGADTVTELVSTTRASTGCGSCRDSICALADWLRTDFQSAMSGMNTEEVVR